jgi:hypothetical protein
VRAGGGIPKQVAQIERVETGATTAPERLAYLHGDHLGSRQLITKGTGGVSSGIVLHEEHFDPWGNPEGPAAWRKTAPSTSAGFSGHEHDPEHGLVNMKG